MVHVQVIALFLLQSPLDNAFQRIYQDITGVWPKLIGSVILGMAYIGHRSSDTDGMMHRMWPLAMGVGMMAWAPSVYNWLFT